MLHGIHCTQFSSEDGKVDLFGKTVLLAEIQASLENEQQKVHRVESRKTFEPKVEIWPRTSMNL